MRGRYTRKHLTAFPGTAYIGPSTFASGRKCHTDSVQTIKADGKKDIVGRERGYAAKNWSELPARIEEAAKRLRGVQIECRPAVEVIQKSNHRNVLIYADPPYLLETRNGKQYRKEMTDREHEELLDALKAHKGPAIISGYDSELYREYLKHWHREEAYSRTQAGEKKKEILWMNFEPEKQMELNFTEE